MSALKLDTQYNDEGKRRIYRPPDDARHLVSQARKNFKVGGMDVKKKGSLQGMCATETTKTGFDLYPT